MKWIKWKKKKEEEEEEEIYNTNKHTISHATFQTTLYRRRDESVGIYI